jgi:Glycoside-hydrolase family GH114
MKKSLAVTAAAALTAAVAITTQVIRAGAMPDSASAPTVHQAATTSAPAVTVTAPPANGTFDYQIGGAYTPAAAVTILDRDRGAAPVSGKYNICYLNAFQTQPEEASFWTGQHADLLLKGRDGKPVTDPDWPGEMLLDTSTDAKRTAIATIEGQWIDGCASKGFQAIEPDNLDTFTRSGGRLTQANNVAMVTLLAVHAHDAGLAIGQKNTTELGNFGRTQVGFDFAIAEECQAFDECGDYTGPYGAKVIEIEYVDADDPSAGPAAYRAACTARGGSISVILRDRDVVPAGGRAYHYESC